MRSALVGFAFLSLASLASVAVAAPVDISASVLLNADVTATLGDPASPADVKESHDSGNLAAPNVNAQATASVPVDTGDFIGSGSAEAHISKSSIGFVLTGKSSSSLTGTSSLAGEVRSVATIDLAFTIDNGFIATPDLTATNDAMVLRDQKVTLVIDRTGEDDSIFAKTFDDSFSGSLAPLAAGTYHVQLVAGSISTTKGIANETGSSEFQFSIAATPISDPPPTAIPLPTSVWTGGALIAAVFITRRRWGSRLA